MRTFAFPCGGGGHSSVCFPSFPFFLFSLYFPLFSFVFFFNPVKSFLCCMNSGTFEIQRLSSLYCAVHWSDQYTGRRCSSEQNTSTIRHVETRQSGSQLTWQAVKFLNGSRSSCNALHDPSSLDSHKNPGDSFSWYCFGPHHIINGRLIYFLFFILLENFTSSNFHTQWQILPVGWHLHIFYILMTGFCNKTILSKG